MGNYQCYKCGIPEDHIDTIHLMRKHCREHNTKTDSLICSDCSGYKENFGCYHKFKFVWWCNKNTI
jgi:hypothetical protein